MQIKQQFFNKGKEKMTSQGRCRGKEQITPAKKKATTSKDKTIIYKPGTNDLQGSRSST